MIAYMLLNLALVLLLCDAYLFFRHIRRSTSGLWQILFIAQALILDMLVPLMVLFTARSEDAVQWTLWGMWLLFLSLGTKVPFALFVFLGNLLNRLFRKSWRLLQRLGAVAGLIAGLVMIYGATAGVSKVRVVRVQVESPHVPERFDGYRIAFFSDLHVGNLPPSGKLMPRLIDSILMLEPDLIVNGGDLVNIRSSEITQHVYGELLRLQAPDGVVSVLGNHDLGIYIPEDEGLQSLEEVKTIQRKLGWRLLQNENFWIHRGGDSIAVAGVDFPFHGKHNGIRLAPVDSDLAAAMAGIGPGHFSLLVSHTPTLWDSIPEVAPADLTISGHVHAMQMKFTLGKYQFSPASWLYPQWSGLYRKDDYLLYVNDGAGYVLYPMRIGAPAEVTLFELHKK